MQPINSGQNDAHNRHGNQYFEQRKAERRLPVARYWPLVACRWPIISGFHSDITKFRLCVKKILYGYAESPSSALSTTKNTKDTKRDFKFNLSNLRDLRVLRGEITIGGIQLEISR